MFNPSSGYFRKLLAFPQWPFKSLKLPTPSTFKFFNCTKSALRWKLNNSYVFGKNLIDKKHFFKNLVYCTYIENTITIYSVYEIYTPLKKKVSLLRSSLNATALTLHKPPLISQISLAWRSIIWAILVQLMVQVCALYAMYVNWTRLAQVVKRQARDLEVRGSNPGPGSKFSLEFKL